MKRKLMALLLTAVMLLSANLSLFVGALTLTEVERGEEVEIQEESETELMATTPKTVTTSEVLAKINDLVSKLNGKYFTINQKACVIDASDKEKGFHGRCGMTDAEAMSATSNCYNVNVVKATWFKNMFGEVNVNNFPRIGTTSNAWTCAGFANFAQWYIFKTNNTDKVSATTICKDVAVNEANLAKYCKPGDGIRVYNGDKAHSFIYISANSYLDCNGWDAGLSKPSIVQLRNANIASRFGDRKMEVCRANNYDVSDNPSIASDGALYLTYNDPDNAHYVNASAATGNALTSIPNEDGSGCGYVVVTKYSSDGDWGYVNYKGVVGWTRLYEPYIKYVSAYTCPVVSFNANGGSVAVASKKVYINTPYGSMPTPTRTGYNFAGWYTSASGGSRITDTTNVTLTGNQTLYAQWTAKNYTVAFNANGGSVSISAKAVTYKSTYGSLPTPTRTGYAFAGWYTSASGGSLVTSASNVTITSNQTLYAHWTANTYTITFDANGGTGAPNAITKTHGVDITIPSTVPTREGYTFKGWAGSANGSIEKKPGEICSYNHDTGFYAIWSKEKWLILDPNGGSGVVDRTCLTSAGELVNFPGIDPNYKKTGYTMIGWSTSPTATTAQYGGSDQWITFTYDDLDDNLTLYAVWKRSAFTITFNPNGGKIVSGDRTKTLENGAALGTLPTPEYYGYTFDGWYTAESGGTKVTASTTVTANMTLYAHWTAIPYTVTFVAEGAAVPGTTSIPVTSGCVLPVITPPQRAGYLFDGYYDFANGEGIKWYDASGKNLRPTWPYAADAKLFANWIKDQTTVAVTGVTLNKTVASLTVGDRLNLIATVTPADATDPSVSWKSSDTSIATVENGVVTAVAPGTVTITVTTADGGKTASCVVTVSEPIAEDAATLEVSKVISKAGQTVDVTIAIKNNPGIISMRLKVSYDDKNMTLIKVTNGTVLNNPYHSIKDLSQNPYVLSWGDDTATENNAENGTIVTLTFQIKDTAEEGIYPVNVTYDNTNAGIYDMDFNLIDFAVIDGSVEIKNYICGDLNGDGQVNSFDRTILARYIAKWKGYEKETFVYEAADVNEDGEVNAFDRTILARYIAKWAEYSELPKK